MKRVIRSPITEEKKCMQRIDTIEIEIIPKEINREMELRGATTETGLRKEIQNHIIPPIMNLTIQKVKLQNHTIESF